MGAKFLLRHVARLLLTVIAAGILGSVVVRFAPAYGVDESDLDPRLSREYVRESQARRTDPVAFLWGLLHRDFGVSSSLRRPVAELLRERLPVTLRGMAMGAGIGLAAGLTLALAAVSIRWPLVATAPAVMSSVFLAVPSGALALLCLVAGLPASMALAALLFPRVYAYARAILLRAAGAPHVLAARARGVPGWRILAAHVVPVAGPQLLAVLGMTVAIAFPAMVPIEAVADLPGVGQLAWKAALARDLPVLVTLTMVASVIVLAGNAASDFSADAARRGGG